ncbi:MAG: 4-hydroxybenzoate octaprenyltransferase [Gemmataceae bacterium]|nr:4-hydroxybenzoate octaprenyltransferase [Gemmataceae bacterium]
MGRAVSKSGVKTGVELARNYLDLVKFSHTVFALPFALISGLLAWKIAREFHWLQLAGILACMVTGRTAGMAFNRLVDSTYDKNNPRTSGRHLPAGILTKIEVWSLFFLTLVGFFASAALFLLINNPWPLILSPLAMVVLLGYSLAKRFTSLSHFWLGFALSLAPLGAWVAIRGLAWSEAPIPLMLTGAVLFWVAGFDILYSCQDMEFDRGQGLFSIPARWGINKSLKIAFVAHMAMLLFLTGLYFLAPHLLGWIYLGGVAAAGLLVLYQHSLVRADDLSRVNRAFFHVNAVISLGLLAVVAAQVWLAR